MPSALLLSPAPVASPTQSLHLGRNQAARPLYSALAPNPRKQQTFLPHILHNSFLQTQRKAASFSSSFSSTSSASSQKRSLQCSCMSGESGSSTKQDYRTKAAKDISIVVVGSTGYIGKFVVKELVKRGYNVIAVARERSGIGGKARKEDVIADFAGADVRFADATDLQSLSKALEGTSVDVVVSCLASRNGGIEDSWRVDYQATRNSLDAGATAGAQHFVLLSAICVQKPLLEFQRAKLKFESELEAFPGVTHSIVRPTAFFKSLSGQVQSVKGGGPYVMFGDGQLCACKPISEEDLARFMADCVVEPEKVNKVLPIGGPGKALTPLEQGTILFEIIGREPKFIKVPIQVMDGVIWLLDTLAKAFPGLKEPAEFGKIGRYYAAESMLVMDPKTGKYSADSTPSYGKDTLEECFRKLVRDGMAGQELGEQQVFF